MQSVRREIVFSFSLTCLFAMRCHVDINSHLTTSPAFLFWPLPINAVGIFCFIGFPVTALVMGYASEAVTALTENEDADDLDAITASVTTEELTVFNNLGFNDNETLDLSEFLVLCIMRLGTLTPAVIHRMVKRFHELDDSADGAYVSQFRPCVCV